PGHHRGGQRLRGDRAGRPHRHRNARRRRHRFLAAAFPPARRRGPHLDFRHRRAREPGGLEGPRPLNPSQPYADRSAQMAKEPWKTNDWFVSEWNYADEVRKDFKFAKNIKIHDVTLRDGEQQTGIILTKDDKIRIAEALAEAGVHRIEAGMPIVSPSDNDAIKEIVKRNLGPQIFSFARCMKEDVQRSIDTGVS